MEFELTIMMKEGNESNGDQTMNNELNLLWYWMDWENKLQITVLNFNITRQIHDRIWYSPAKQYPIWNKFCHFWSL
jgi:hypothetical protein